MAEGSDRHFGQVLRRFRQLAGLSQEALAERAGLSVRGISDLERGRRREPRLETVRMLAGALDLDDAGRAELIVARGRAESPRSESVGAGPGTSGIPTELDPLIGRERELAEIAELLSITRLLTLTGPGGIGKTRLGIATVQAAASDFPDGVHYLELAPVRSASLVAPAIAEVFGIPQAGEGALLDRVQAGIGDKRLLLVLDNFEHVIDAAPVVAGLLRHCPRLRVLVTSRVRLRLRGEQEFPVPPLALPESEERYSAERLAQYPATELFLQRARQGKPGFDVTPESAAAVAGICKRLDGLPLAIELAAARVKVLAPKELLDRLERPLSILTGGSRDLPDRQQTIRRTIQWSYDLLDEETQCLLRLLSVFIGGWTIEAAEAVADLDGNQRGAVLDRLVTLVDSNLVTRTPRPDGSSRFGMLEVIREFGLEQLEACDATLDARSRHANYLLTWVVELSPELRGPRGALRQHQIAMDHDNLRAALTFALEIDPDRALHVAARLEKYWFTRGAFNEWDYWLDEALRRSVDPAPADRANALHQIGYVAVQHGGLRRARASAEESFAIASDLNLLEQMGRAMGVLGMVAGEDGDQVQAMALHEQALAYYRQSGVEIAVAAQSTNIAILFAKQGDYQRAIDMFEEVLRAHRALGETFFTCMNLANLGHLLLLQGKLDEASRRLDECLELARDLGAMRVVARALIVKGYVAIDRGAFALAATSLVEGLALARDMTYEESVAFALEGLAMISMELEEATVAARLFGAALSIRLTGQYMMNAVDQARCDRYRERCRSAVDERTWQEAWDVGLSQPVNEVIDLALSMAGDLSPRA